MENSIVLYQSEDESISLDVRLQDDSAWLMQVQLADLFQWDKSTVSRHLRNVFGEGKLDYNSVVAKNATIATKDLIIYLIMNLIKTD